MSLDADFIVDRRRMRRKLTFWRVFAVLFAICAVVAAGMAVRAQGSGVLAGATGTSIARITITGLIRTDRERVEALERLGKSPAKAVIVHINSPGGTTSGSEELHDSLMRLKDEKPVVVVVDGLAARAATSRARCRSHRGRRDLAGRPDRRHLSFNSAMLKTLGIRMEEIKSSPLSRAERLRADQPEARAAIEAIVMDSYAWFRNLVKTRRGLDDAALDRVADGRVFTGRQGVGLKLVDELGDERAAVAWLAKEKNIDPKTPVRDYRLRDRFSDLPFLHTTAVVTLEALGLGSFARRIEESGALQAIERLNLDGLLALWHPQAAN
jgi:protease-4